MRTFTEVPISVCFELSELRQVNKAEVMEANQNLVLIVFQQVPKLHLWERKIFLSSDMMNLPPQHDEKQEIDDLSKFKKKYKPNQKT